MFSVESHTEGNRRSSDSYQSNERRHNQTQQDKTPSRKVSNDDVFIVPDTPASNDEIIDQVNNEHDNTAIRQQKSLNWADCPIDESAIEPSPPPSTNNTLIEDDFQVKFIFKHKIQVNKTKELIS